MAGRISEVGDETFQKEVLESTIPVFVDFWAPWCVPCRAIRPTLENLSDAYYIVTHFLTGLGSAAGIQMSFKSLYGLNLGKYELMVALISIGFMEFIQKIETRGGMRHLLSEKPTWIRWPIYYMLLLFLILFGEYNDQAFIYFQF